MILEKEIKAEIIDILKTRFEKNMNRHKSISWVNVQEKFEANPQKLWSLNEMEMTGGEPDVVGYDKKSDVYIFFDCSIESPKGRRSLCYDQQALDSRKANKPKGSAIDMAKSMGVSILNEDQYRELQKLGKFDNKTSSWIETPNEIRKLGGAIFADYRYETIFIYHNGAESYYSSRGFRSILRV